MCFVLYIPIFLLVLPIQLFTAVVLVVSLVVSFLIIVTNAYTIFDGLWCIVDNTFFPSEDGTPNKCHDETVIRAVDTLTSIQKQLQSDIDSTSHLSAKASCSINFETNNILLYPDNHTIQQTEQSISSAFISSIDDILALSSHNTDIFNLTNVSTTLGIIEKQYDATPVSLFDVHFSLSKSLPCDETISKMDTTVISTSLWTSLPCVGASVNAQDFYQETKSILEGEVVTGNFGNVMIEKAFDSSSMNMIGESMMRSTMRCGSLDIKYISE